MSPLGLLLDSDITCRPKLSWRFYFSRLTVSDAVQLPLSARSTAIGSCWLSSNSALKRRRTVRRTCLRVNFGSGESRLKIMFISRFFRLGAHTIKSVINAPTVTPRTPCFPVLHNQYLGAVRHQLLSSTASKLDSEDGNVGKEKINVTFVDKDGEETHIKVPVGMSMLEAAHENDIDLEGACEGSLACSTCHVIVMDVDHYNKLSDPTDEENDMLDLAFGLSETSRLGCQIIAKPELDGLRLAIPAATRNFAVDGYKPKPH